MLAGERRAHEAEFGGDSGLHAAPSFAHSMLMRVRFFGAEVPLWSVIMPVVIVGALATAFAVSAASAVAVAGLDTAAAAASSLLSASASAVVPGVASALPNPTTSAAVAQAANSAGSFELPPASYTSQELFQLSNQREQQQQARARELRAALLRDPGAIEEPSTLAALAQLIDDPATAAFALETTAGLPAPQAADLLYEIWTGTAERGRTPELARALLYSKDLRQKASSALAVALDLRIASDCDANLALLPRAKDEGDRRSLHLLTKLQRRYGCGPNKRLDCYPCLRPGTALDDAISAVRDRKEPKTFGKR